MRKLFYNPHLIIQVSNTKQKYLRYPGKNFSEPLSGYSIVTENGIISEIIQTVQINKNEYSEIIDLTGKILLPGLIESHTHIPFAGSRASEFRERLSGVSYEEITKRGGGINTTVKATRACSEQDLTAIVKSRIDDFIKQGVTTLELKSGYGLDYESELKILNVINNIKKTCNITLIPTFLGAHLVPFDFKNRREEYIKLICEKMLPDFVGLNLISFCDIFIEKEAFTIEESERIFCVAKKLNLRVKSHSNQFHSIGGIDVSLRFDATSVDHLEVLTEHEINQLANSETCCTILPGVSYTLDYTYAPARKLLDLGGIVALATDFNPGTSHIKNIPFIFSLAAVKLKMTINEIIAGYTLNAAYALGLSDITGSIEPGKNADFAIFDSDDAGSLIYNTTENLNVMTIKNGIIIYSFDKR
ncbi:MAG: imidazolonepropionase [Ignavibacteriaceae bacterium]|nr:imidazolonepropionase [Ignavibacteriaceae bacterium]